MILLDTNFLIMSLLPGTPQDRQLRQWLAANEHVQTSVIVWAEFLCGPLTAEQSVLAQMLFPHPEPLVPADAERAAELFNGTGRRRGSLADCLIAATSMRLDALLVSGNQVDFRRFEPMGLRVFAG